MRRRRGVVFVVTLAILLGLVAAVANFSQSQRSFIRRDIDRLEQQRAKIAAEAGIQRALTSLQAVAEAPQNPVTQQDDWATLGNTGADNFKLANASFRLQIVDLSGRIDINTAQQAQLQNLSLTQEQLDSLLDWREPGQTPRAEGGKDAYYNGLTNPYNARLGRIQSVDELLDIKGFNAPALYEVQDGTQPQNGAQVSTANQIDPVPLADLLACESYSPNTSPDGNGKVNLNQPTLTAQQLAQRLQIPNDVAILILADRQARTANTFASLSQVIQIQAVQTNQAVLRNILDGATLNQGTRVEGRINVNTASANVLVTIPGVTADIANRIVEQQTGTGFTRLSDLLPINATPQFLGSVADFMTVQSNSFEVRSIGTVGSISVTLIATVVIENGVLRITRVQEAPFNNMPARWNWTDATNDVVLQEAS